MRKQLRAYSVSFIRKFKKGLPKDHNDFTNWHPLTAIGSQHKRHTIYPGRDIDTSGFPFSGPADIYSHDSAALVYELSNGKVWGNTGTVITPDNIMLAEVSNEFVLEPARHSLFKQWKLRKPVQLKDTIAVVATTGATVYYHWLLQHLPRLHLLQQAPLYQEIAGFVLNYTGLPFQTDSLQQLNIPRSKIISSNTRDFYVQAERLIVPSLPFHPYASDNTTLWACRFLRETFLKGAVAVNPDQFLYLSRNKSIGRRVVNEEALMNKLSSLGFRILDTASMTVRQQAQAFNQAKVVIAPHGGALANIVFCNKGTTIIDIFNEKWINPCFWDISNKLELQYHPYIAKAMNGKEKQDAKHYDSVVDLTDFDIFLNKLLS